MTIMKIKKRGFGYFRINLNLIPIKKVLGYRGPYWLGFHWPFTKPKDPYADWWEIIFCGWILSLGIHK